jgi:hypothetical protein
MSPGIIASTDCREIIQDKPALLSQVLEDLRQAIYERKDPLWKDAKHEKGRHTHRDGYLLPSALQ